MFLYILFEKKRFSPDQQIEIVACENDLRFLYKHAIDALDSYRLIQRMQKLYQLNLKVVL